MFQAALLLTCCVLCLGSLQFSPTEEHTVYPTFLYERSSESKLVLRLTESLILNLQKSSVLAPEILLIEHSERETRHTTVNTSDIQERLYHDRHHQSSLLVLEKDGALHIEGVVNSNLRIKPVPERPRSSQGQVLHSIYRVDEGDEKLMSMDVTHERSVRWNPQERSYTYRPSWFPSSAPPIRTPNAKRFVVEVHVVSCKVHQANFAKNVDLISYLAVTMNAVNMRYLDMASPQISFMLVGISRSLDDKFVSRVSSTGVHATNTLQGLANYYSAGNIPGKPDAVYFMTSQDLVLVQNGAIDRGLLGYAFIGTVCTRRGVAVGEDIALSYSGVLCMAHELAHSLGAVHDTTPECPWAAGFLMSYVDGGTNRHRLSNCSERQIRSTVRTLPLTCIHVRSHTNLGDKNTAVPGQKITEDDYCNKLYKNRKLPVTLKALKVSALTSRCKMKCCLGYTSKCEEVDILEGMSCRGTMTCRRGVCGHHGSKFAGN